MTLPASPAAAGDEPSSRVSMQDIARAAGVHRSTVSLALRNQARIPEATRERILKVAQALGYAPDPLLDAFNFHRLATHPTRASPVIAFLSDRPSREAFEASRLHREAFAGAKERAARMGFRLDLFLTGPGQLSPARLDHVLRSRSILCVIVGLIGPATTELNLDWKRYCVVAIDSFHLRPELDAVTLDHRGMGREAARELLAAGHRRIGFVVTEEEDRRLQQLPLAGYLLACARDAAATIPPLHLPALHARTTSELLDAWVREHRPTALVAGCAAVAGAARAGLLAPGLAWAGPGLAGQAHGYEHVGARAAELLPLRQQASQRGVPPRRTTMVLPAGAAA